ncbi:MAG: hypothetical protein II719_02765, partial [Clostridia bacterium]|nr:hypothetical protein [Clostridia bacterium]
MKAKWLIPFGILIALAAASCGDTSATVPAASSDLPASSGSETEETETSGEPVQLLPEPDLGEIDFGGEEFWVLAPPNDQVYHYWTVMDGDEFILSEGLNGEIVNDAVFNRNLQIESKLNIKIRKLTSETVVEDALEIINGGDSSIDLIYSISSDMGDYVPSGYFYDWNDIPHVDFSQPYWYQLAFEGLSCYGKQFMVPSDITMSALSGASLVYFNKRILAEHDLESPYALVDRDEWTLDNYLSMIRQISKDLNGDGVMDFNDLYGIGTYLYRRYGTFMQLLIGSGELITTPGEDGARQISVDGEKVQALIDRLREVFLDPALAIDCDERFKLEGSYDMIPSFVDGHFLFVQSTVACMQRDLREMEDDFGIAPNPKYDEYQESYYHRALPFTSMFEIPMTAPNQEMTGAFLQYATWLSHSTVLPAYYEITIKQKRARDEEAIRMLDIVHDTIYFDWSDVYNTHISDYLWNAYESGSYARSFTTV